MLPTRWFPRLMLACAAIWLAGGTVLAVRLSGVLNGLNSHPPQDAQALRTAVVSRTLLVFVVTALGTAILVWAMFRGVARTTAKLEAAARDVAAGNLNGDVPAERGDEFGRLAQRFNEMTAAVKQRLEERKAREHQLEEREEFLQAVLATMVEAVIAVDGNQRILFANRASRKLLGMNHSELVGRPIWEVARSPVLQETLRKVLTEHAEQRIEFQLPRTKSIAILAAGRLPGNPPPGAVLVLHDVTELRQLENLRREFVSNVSHELKTPLTTIQAYAETLLDGALDDPRHSREFVQRIADQGDRLHGLILDLLALARIESKEQAFDMAPIAVADVVADCVAEHLAVAQKKGLELTADVRDEHARVLADAEGLRTILDNLLDNALNHTPSGGRVTVRCESADGKVCLQVADTGIGIPREHHDRIFERFYRVDKARSRELGGTGLGLSIVKHLAQVFGGNVSVASSPGKGSTFTVELPLRER
jgi:two-component system phosphate regulon sensor histidine kinase PhoR